MTDYRRKADQAWEMAGLARQDGDVEDSVRQTKNAQMYERLARGLPAGEPAEETESQSAK